MSKRITLGKRVNVILALAIVFLLVFATNRIDQKHFEVAQKSVKEVYTDRVLVQDYIFSISNLLFTKRLALKDTAVESAHSSENKEIRQLLLDFNATKLTSAEVKYLNALEVNFKVLKRLELQEIQEKEESEYVKILEKMQATLQKLSEIQTRESKDLTHTAQKSLDMNQLLSNVEIGFLIVTGIAIQFVIFYRVKKSFLKK